MVMESYDCDLWTAVTLRGLRNFGFMAARRLTVRHWAMDCEMHRCCVAISTVVVVILVLVIIIITVIVVVIE